MKLFVVLLLVLGMAVAGKAASAPHSYDVLTQHYSGNKYVSISAPVAGDEPTVDYYLYPTGADTDMREYDHIHGWVVAVEWHAGDAAPKWAVWYDDCGMGCGEKPK